LVIIPGMKKAKFILFSVLLGVFVVLLMYYFYPYTPIARDVVIDKIVVMKSNHKLFAFSHNVLIRTFLIATGKGGNGEKQFEGDQKTPEGVYFINSKNTNSGFHKNLGISYPNFQDIIKARTLGKAAGAEIKIHGLRNGQGFIGKFQRWRDWTNGCIGLTNEEIDDLYAHTPLGTTVLIFK
jgi:murein L,D-transpeptidase YafK